MRASPGRFHWVSFCVYWKLVVVHTKKRWRCRRILARLHTNGRAATDTDQRLCYRQFLTICVNCCQSNLTRVEWIVRLWLQIISVEFCCYNWCGSKWCNLIMRACPKEPQVCSVSTIRYINYQYCTVFWILFWLVVNYNQYTKSV